MPGHQSKNSLSGLGSADPPFCGQGHSFPRLSWVRWVASSFLQSDLVVDYFTLGCWGCAGYCLYQWLQRFSSTQYAQQSAGFLLSLLTPGVTLVGLVDPTAFCLLSGSLPDQWCGACWSKGKGFILLPLARRIASLSRLELQTDALCPVSCYFLGNTIKCFQAAEA